MKTRINFLILSNEKLWSSCFWESHRESGFDASLEEMLGLDLTLVYGKTLYTICIEND